MGQEAMACWEGKEFRDVLTKYGGPNASALLCDPKLLKATFDLLKSIQNREGVGIASAVLSGGKSSAKAMKANSTVTTSLSGASMLASTFKATMESRKILNLSALGKVSPLGVATFVGATFIQKSGIALSLAGGDQEKARCYGAIMELAGSAATTAVVVAASAGALSWLTAASLTASSINAYMSCQSLL